MFFPLPRPLRESRRRSDASWPSIPTSRPTTSTHFSPLRHRRTARLQGHRRRRGEFQFPGAHQRAAISSSRCTRSAWPAADLPFFLGADGASGRARHHLPAAGEEQRKAACSARIAGRPAAIVTFLDGLWIRRPNAGHCAAVGEALARLHLAGADFPMKRANALSDRKLAAALRARQGARRQRAAGPVRGDRQGTRRARKVPGRAICRRA